MRIPVFIVTVIAGTLLTLGGAALIVVTAPPEATWLLVLPTLGIVFIVSGATVLLILTSYWDGRSSVEDRKLLRLWLIIVTAFQLLSVVATVVYSVLSPAPWWLPAALLAATVLLDLGSIAGGRRELRQEQANRPIDSSWSPISSAEIARKGGVVAITFAVSLAIALTVFVVFARDDADSPTLLAFVFAFAFLAASVACMAVTLPIARTLRDVVGRDRVLTRKVARVVIMNKNIDLDDDEQVVAAKYAVIISVYQSFGLAYFSMLYVALAIQQVTRMGNGGLFPLVFLVSLVVVFVGVLPLQVLRIRRSRRYAREHADRLPQPN